MDSRKKTARLAGFIYLIVVLTGIFSMAYVPSKLIEWNDANQTFQNISFSIQLFRFCIAASIVCYIAFLILSLVLYNILHNVNKKYAMVMVALVIISIPISFINLQNKFAVLSLVIGTEYLKVFDTEQLQSQVMWYLEAYYSGILINQVFWGLWLLPFGYLVYQSKFLPKILGVFLMLGCLGYLINVFGKTLIHNFDQYAISEYVTIPGSIGEIGICLWLLIFGTKKDKRENGSN